MQSAIKTKVENLIIIRDIETGIMGTELPVETIIIHENALDQFPRILRFAAEMLSERMVSERERACIAP